MALVYTIADLPVLEGAPGTRSRVIASGARGATCMSVAEIWLDPGAEIPAHRHPAGIEEVVWVVSGQAQFRVGEEIAEVGPDCTVVIPPLSEHAIRAVGPDELKLWTRWSAAAPTTLRDDGSDGEPELPGT